MITDMTIEQLNNRYALAGQLRFVEGKGGLPFIEVGNTSATAVISVYSGQVLSYQPVHETHDLLFVSDAAYFEHGKAIKGGVPVCWPWFGADPEGKGRAAHGFVRNRMWSVLSTRAVNKGLTRISLGLTDSDATHALWPHAFALTLEISVGETLSLALITRNTGKQPCTITQALHTYFQVGDISQVSIRGLENAPYLDKVAGGVEKTQQGVVSIAGEVDRVYTRAQRGQVIVDAALQRRIHISSQGSSTAVVWNPWEKICRDMADLRDDDYQHFVCVETANAADDIVKLAPGGEHRLQAEYRIER